MGTWDLNFICDPRPVPFPPISPVYITPLPTTIYADNEAGKARAMATLAIAETTLGDDELVKLIHNGRGWLVAFYDRETGDHLYNV